jgi:spire-like protein
LIDTTGIRHNAFDTVIVSPKVLAHMICVIYFVPQRCCNHLGAPSPQQADAHYRAVCRALVAEALELSSFLEKVSQGTQELRAKAEAASTDLDKLQFSDWVS